MLKTVQQPHVQYQRRFWLGDNFWGMIKGRVNGMTGRDVAGRGAWLGVGGEWLWRRLVEGRFEPVESGGRLGRILEMLVTQTFFMPWGPQRRGGTRWGQRLRKEPTTWGATAWT